jgi:hypothetical protein
MSEVMTLTRKGRHVLKSGNIGLSPLHHLLMVICARIGDDVVSDNMLVMVRQLVSHYGGIEAAIDAINSGQVGFAKAN